MNTPSSEPFPARVSVESAGVLLMLGDCLERMKEIPDGAVVISDPPFNIGYHYASYSDNLKYDEYMAMLVAALRPPCVIIHYPEAICDIARAFGRSPDRIAQWVYPSNTARQHRSIAWFGCSPDFTLDSQPYKNPSDKRIKQRIADGKTCRIYDWWVINQVKNVGAEKTAHPCQMPTAVMERIVRITPCEIVSDPFMGSGTTGVACVNLGRRFIGIERDETYFNIARARIEAAMENFGGPNHPPAVADGPVHRGVSGGRQISTQDVP
jgi:site-specific DNA-methyltransferase (adenine-specific)